MKMRYQKIFIDASNFFHRAHCCFNGEPVDLPDGTQVATGGIFIGINMMNRLERDFLIPGGKIFFLFDNTHSGDNKRKEIDPEYKSNRTKKDDSFYRGLDLFQMILLSYKSNLVMVKVTGKEADDLVDPLVKKFPDEKILLVSNDLDWFRSISDLVHVAKYEKGNYNIYGRDEFYEKFQFEPTVDNLCLYKAFRGDKSDNVQSGVPGIREVTLVQLINEFDSIKEIFHSLPSIDYISDNFKKKIKENYSRLLLNYDLVSYEVVDDEELSNGTFEGKFQPNSLYSLYKMLNFDIEKFDPRVSQFFPKEDKKNEGFFQFDKVPRA